jgi:hypothetical protein
VLGIVNVDGEAETDEAEVGIDDKECGAEAGSGNAKVYERMGRRSMKAFILPTIAKGWN